MVPRVIGVTLGGEREPGFSLRIARAGGSGAPLEAGWTGRSEPEASHETSARGRVSLVVGLDKGSLANASLAAYRLARSCHQWWYSAKSWFFAE